MSTKSVDNAPGTMDAGRLVDYAKSLDCIHCGLCLHTCPTYQLTGAEASSPRGRIHLMRGVAEGRLDADEAFADEMDFCLVCRHCESVCPAGVEFGAMMEFTRDGLGQGKRAGPLARLARWLGLRVVLASRGGLGAASMLLRLAQRSRVIALVAPLLGARGRALRALPEVPTRAERAPLPQRSAAHGERLGAAALLEGCVMPELLGRVNRTSVTCLGAAGIECRTARGHACCGALHAHNGDLAGARRLARATIEAFDTVRGEDGAQLEVVVNSAGCGAHMKEYDRLLANDPDWAERARAFARRVVDFTEYLARPVYLERLREALASKGAREPGAPVTYDDPCHLCHGQQIRAEPRVLLDAIPGLERIELDGSEGCCGSAGVYSMLRPTDSQLILAGKLEALRTSGAKTLVTANPGCQLQWLAGIAQTGGDVDVVHIAEVLARALADDAK